MTDQVSVTGYVDHSAVDHQTVSNGGFARVSWGAILSGVVIALVVQFLLNLLGVGIGAAMINPGMPDNPAASTFSIATGLWFVAAGIIAAFAGGYVASRLSGRTTTATGGLHGLTSWAVTTLVVLFLLTTSVGALVGGAFSGLSSVIGGVGKTATSAASMAAPAIMESANPMGDIEKQIRTASGGNDPEALRTTAVTSVQALLTGDKSKAADARIKAADALAKAEDIPVDQARAQVQQYEATYRQAIDSAKEQATAAAQTATKVVSRGALFAFAALLLGGLGGWFGGVSGIAIRVRPTEASRRGNA